MAIEMTHQLAPNVITMDIGLPDMRGLGVMRRLKMELPRVEVVVTVHGERDYGEEAVKARAAHREVMPGRRGSGCPRLWAGGGDLRGRYVPGPVGGHAGDRMGREV